MNIPSTPVEFFEDFFPKQFREHRSIFDVGDDSSTVSLVVENEGAWSFRIAGGELEVIRGLAEDSVIQVVFTTEDFEAVVIRKAKDDYRRTGRITDESLGPFRLLFSMEKKRSFFEREQGSMLFVIDDQGDRRKMHIVLGAGEPPQKARAVFQLSLKNVLALFNGHTTGVKLFMLRKLKIKGDMGFAVKANSLLA